EVSEPSLALASEEDVGALAAVDGRERACVAGELLADPFPGLGGAVELEVEGHLAVGEQVAAVTVRTDAAADAVLGPGFAVPAPEPLVRMLQAALDERAEEARDGPAVLEVGERERR